MNKKRLTELLEIGAMCAGASPARANFIAANLYEIYLTANKLKVRYHSAKVNKRNNSESFEDKTMGLEMKALKLSAAIGIDLQINRTAIYPFSLWVNGKELQL